MKSYIQPNFEFMAQISGLMDSPSLRNYAALVASECMRVVTECDAGDVRKLFPIPNKTLLEAFDRKHANELEFFAKVR